MKSKQQPNRIYTKPFKTIPRNVKIHLQAGSCTSIPYSQFKMRCQSCTQGEPCSFINLRGFKVSNVDGKLVYGPYFPATENPDLLHRCRSLRFKTKPYSRSAKSYALKKIRSTLQKALKRQMDVLLHKSNKPIQRDHIEGYRHMCDSCSTSIFIHHYVCAHCAIEICIDCYEGLNSKIDGVHTSSMPSKKEHSQSEFVLFSKLSENSIFDLIGNTAMEVDGHLYNEADNNDYEVKRNMSFLSSVSNSEDNNFIKSFVSGGSSVARFKNIHNTVSLLPCDVHLSTVRPSYIPDNYTSPCVGDNISLTEPYYNAANYQDFGPAACFDHGNHKSLSSITISSTDELPYDNYKYASPPLADSSSATDSSCNTSYNTNYQKISSVPFFTEFLDSIDHPYISSYSSHSAALEPTNFGNYLSPFVNDDEYITGLDQSRHPQYRRKSNILDNEQGVDLPTYISNQLGPSIEPDETYKVLEYDVSDEYSAFNNNQIMYNPNNDHLHQNQFSFYEDYASSRYISKVPDDTDIKHVGFHKKLYGQTINQPSLTVLSFNRNKLGQLQEYNTGLTPTSLFKSSQIGNFNYVNSEDLNNVYTKTKDIASYKNTLLKKASLFGNIVNMESHSSNTVEQRGDIAPKRSNIFTIRNMCHTQESFAKPETTKCKGLNHYEGSSITSDTHNIKHKTTDRNIKIEEHQVIDKDNSTTSFLSCLYPDHEAKQDIHQQETKSSSTNKNYDTYLKMAASELTLDIFQKHWQTHRPVHITGSTGNSEFEWTPQMFSKVCGSDIIQATDYDNSAYDLKAKEYFNAFSDRKKRQQLCKKLGSTEVLKIKDWPQTQELKNKLPGLYDDFMRTVPVPEYCSESGYLNMANRLPEEYLPPDLGPKMFISYGSDNNGRNGKTNLHCDITDAVNVMYYADDKTSKDQNKPKAASIWHIFPHDSLEKLQEYITKYKHCDELHPIFDHAFFLTQTDLKKLQDEFEVVPYTIYQNPGDAVFIPAGCAHQVINYSNSIKCAFDFLSPENAESSLFISNELRKLKKQDALQVQTTLAFAWVSLKSDTS